jgi:RNA polymerase sigma factor (sigma-70 family)
MGSSMSRFERLYRDNYPFVWAAARRCGAPDDAVGDVVQDVFVTAHRRLDELHYEVSPRGWLYGVTRRVAFRYRRSAARTARRNAAVARASPRVELPHARLEAARELERLLARIDADQREAFEMSELLGMSGPEIAGELGVPLNTIYSRVRLARRRLEGIAGAEPGLDVGLEAARLAQRPPPGESRRAWGMLAPIVGSPWTSLRLGLAAARTSLAFAAVVAVGAIAVAIPADSSVPADAPTSDAAPIAGRGASDRAPTEAAAVASAAPAPTPTPTPPGRGESPSAVERPPETAKVEASARDGQPAPGSPPGQDALAAEVAGLERARKAMATEPASALVVLDELDRRFADGQLLDARQSARVRTLCRLGRTEEAERLASALHREYPRSSVVRNTPKKCEAT